MTTLKVNYGTGTSDPRDLMSEEELAVERAVELEKLRVRVRAQGGRKYSPDQPRDDHGRFGEGGGSSTATATTTATPTTTAEVRSLWAKDFNAYTQELHAHGGPLPETSGRFTAEGVYSSMNVSAANPEGVTEEQRALCEEAAAKFLNDPEMQPLFDEYGKPGVVVASGLVTPTSGDPDATYPGQDPADPGVTAQWSNGTIFLYGDTAGNPSMESSPGFSIAGADPFVAMQHEYGHQIMGVIGYNADGSASDFRTSFIQALGDNVAFTDHMTNQQEHDFQANVQVETGQVSEYATSSPDEAFAEFFAESLQPGFSIDNYDGGAADAFRLIQDRIAADTGKKP